MDVLRVLERVLGATAVLETNGVRRIEMTVKYRDRIDKWFPTGADQNKETRFVDVTFNGNSMSAVLHGTLIKKTYTGTLPAGTDIASIQSNKWTLTHVSMDRAGTDRSDPEVRTVHYKCNGVDIILTHTLGFSEGW